MSIRSGYERDEKPKINKGDIAILIAIVLAFICCFAIVGNAQTTTRKYDGINRIRIQGNANVKKPCVILFCGGGFTTQTWNVCNTWNDMAVQSGYVSCRVGYTTSLPTYTAAEKGISDCMNAVRWVKKYANTYNIDTNEIYLMGTSAGGFCAMGAYMYKVKVAGILNGWGGVLRPEFLNNMTIPVFNVSSDVDLIVPVGCGEAFGTPCCGSQYINVALQNRGVKSDWLVFYGRKHGLLPNDAQYNLAIKKSFNDALAFFNN